MNSIDEILDLLFRKINSKYSYSTSRYVITKEYNNKTCQLKIIKKMPEATYESNL